MRDPIDMKHDILSGLAQEAADNRAAPQRSFNHGQAVGAVVEMTLAALEANRLPLWAHEKRGLIEGIVESCWPLLEDRLNGAKIDFDEAEEGLQSASPRYRSILKEKQGEAA